MVEQVLEAEIMEVAPTAAPELAPEPDAPTKAPPVPAPADSPGDAPAEAAPAELPPAPTPTATTGTSGFRTWTDISGQYHAQAQLVSVSGDQVRLLKSDGQYRDVPLERLSSDDRQYVGTIRAVAVAH